MTNQLTPDEQRFVDAMRDAGDEYVPFQKNEILRLIEIIDRLTLAQASALAAPGKPLSAAQRAALEKATIYGNIDRSQINKKVLDNLLERGYLVQDNAKQWQYNLTDEGRRVLGVE